MLPALVRALLTQTHAIGRILGVDTGSRDRSGAILAELIGGDSVFGMDRATGFGQAVWGALRRAPARRPPGDTGPGSQALLSPGGTEGARATGTPVEWVWLLHDDCEPAPDTLERLLRAASRDRKVVVLGPKVLDGTDRRVLREAGVAIDRSGRRVTGIDAGEFDQGQHDHNRAVLAVGSAGMLVRRDVWEQLRGFDTHLRMFRDDVDFCWRVHSAGYRVQVVTDAVLYHRELTARRGRRPEGISARRLDRRNALYVLAASLPLLPLLATLAGCVAGTLLRAAYFLLTKQGEQAMDQLTALGELLGHPLRLLKARGRRAPGRGQGYSAVRMFIPRGRPLRQLGETLASLTSDQGTGGAHHATAAPDGSGEDELLTESRSLPRRVMGSHGVRLVFGLLLVAAVAERRLLGTSPLGGGALVPAWGGASALWSEYLAGFHAVGIGSAASAQPYVAVVAGLATILGGQAWLAVDVLLLGSVPLAGLTAYLASRRLVTTPAARAWTAGAYALLPVAMGSVAAGRLGTATVFILLPLLAQAAARMLTAPPRSARRAAWAAGLLTAVATAFVPLVWVVVAGLVLALVAARRWVWPVSLGNAAVVVAVPFLVLFPWSLHLLASPSSFLLEAGLTRNGLSSASLGPQALLLLHPGGPGLPPAWVTAGLALALVSLALGRRSGLVVAGWSVAVAGLAAALAVSRSTIPGEGGGGPVSAWPGAALAIAAVGLLIAAAPAADWLGSGLRAKAGPGGPAEAARPAGAPARALAVIALIVAAAGPAAAAGTWVSAGVRGPVAAVSSPVLPAFLAAGSVSGAQYRTLVLREDGGTLTYSVIRQADPTLGEPELAGYLPAEQALTRQVAALAAPNGADGGDPAQVLAEFGIRWVLLPGPVDQSLAGRLNAAAGVVPVSNSPTYDLWQVAGPVGRARVLGTDGAVSVLHSDVISAATADAPAAGGTLVLAEPAGGWQATLNGRAVPVTARPFDGWAQAFRLPAGGGRLVVTRDSMARDLSLILELVMFLAACVLALPGKRADPEAEAAALAALLAARGATRPARSADGREPGKEITGDAAREAAQGASRPAGRGQRGRGLRARPAQTLKRASRRRVASSPGVHAVSEGELAATSAVGVLDAGSEDPNGSAKAREQRAPAGWDSDAKWSEVLTERDSGAWPSVPGGSSAGTSSGSWRSVTDSDSWKSGDSRTGGLSGPPGPSGASGDSQSSVTDSGGWKSDDNWGLSSDSGGGTGHDSDSQPWEALVAPERSPFEPTSAPADAKAGAGTGPRLAATPAAGSQARDARPAERRSHRAPGRHGRPGRRIWGRSGKDGKDGTGSGGDE